MKCFCEEGETMQLKVEGDIGADPIWCDVCFCNLEVDELPISKQLKTSLKRWAASYGEWIDWENDVFQPNGSEREERHNFDGARMTDNVRLELGDSYVVSFSPSKMAKLYKSKTS